ncbi:MAG: hypothetical protein P1V51_01050 [Deltaproteobacteria bacterium]|nr:hypothetical protein [Deltaproteobacteria bacterium]
MDLTPRQLDPSRPLRLQPSRRLLLYSMSEERRSAIVAHFQAHDWEVACVGEIPTDLAAPGRGAFDAVLLDVRPAVVAREIDLSVMFRLHATRRVGLVVTLVDPFARDVFRRVSPLEAVLFLDRDASLERIRRSIEDRLLQGRPAAAEPCQPAA